MSKAALFFLLLLPILSQAQFYDRYEEENATEFVVRLLGAEAVANGDMELNHEVIEYGWGDKEFGKKIVVFFRDKKKIAEVGNQVWGFILQPICGRRYLRMDLPRSLVGDGHPFEQSEKVVSVFFRDYNDDGHQEMYVIHASEARVYDEEIKMSTWTTRYLTYVFEQRVDNVGFSLGFRELEELSEYLSGSEDEDTAKEKLDSWKDEQKNK